MNQHQHSRRRRLILLGSTGSIGISTLEVVEHLRNVGAYDYEVAALAAGQNATALVEQARRLDVPCIAISEPNNAEALDTFDSRIFTGPDAAKEMVEAIAQPGDLVVGAMVGSAGVPATIAAIERGCDIALANKETLVAAGGIVMPLVQKHGVNLLPVDSEHSAIFQCLPQSQLQGSGRAVPGLARIVITASGGPFRSWSRERMHNATIDEALNHPTWNMGPKVTIDSASLMNKALEVIEAHWLFGLPAEQIEAIIHPQSLIHSFVEYADGSVIAQLSPPDMKTPIQYALTWPERAEGCSKRMDWAALRSMEFEPVDHEKFPALNLAKQVIESGGTSGAIFNAANEASVEAFLAGAIPFGRVVELVHDALEAIPVRQIKSLADVMQADNDARRFVDTALDTAASSTKRSQPVSNH